MHLDKESDVITRNELPKLFEVPIVGRLTLMVGDTRHKLETQMQKKGPIVMASVNKQGNALLLSNDPSIAANILDETIFTKHVSPQISLLWETKDVLGEGLLTASTDSDIWKKARSLMDPVFGKQGTLLHFGAMCNAASVAIETLEMQTEAGASFDLLNFSVRITLHAILLALFSYESDLFDSERKHDQKDVEVSWASKKVLEEAVKRVYLPKSLKRVRGDNGWQDAAKVFHHRLSTIIDERKRSLLACAKPKNDILQQMLGQGMLQQGTTEENEHLIQQLTLLIIAGHETTGSSIAYVFDTLAKNPEIQSKVAAEAHHAGFCGKVEAILPEQLKKLVYTEQVIMESLRMNPPATTLLRIARKDMTISASNGKKYQIKKGDSGSILISSLHGNRKFWPEPNRFDPERFSSEQKAARHPYAFLPFATGPRGCLGRMFALQELKLFVATLVGRFHFLPGHHTRTEVSHYYGITMKPLNAKGLVIRRDVVAPLSTAHRPAALVSAQSLMDICTVPAMKDKYALKDCAQLPKVQVAFGSQHGDCRSMAYELKHLLQRIGFIVADVCSLDNLLTIMQERGDGSPLLFVVTSTYNGEPPENASKFRQSLSLSSRENSTNDLPKSISFLKERRYAVFGAGNSEWRNTYHAFPRFVDETLNHLGGRVLYPMGRGNAEEDLEYDWRAWLSGLISYLVEEYDLFHAVDQDLLQAMAYGPVIEKHALSIRWHEKGEDLRPILEARVGLISELQDSYLSGRSTLSVNIELKGSGFKESILSYEPGDYFEVWPQNSPELVQTALAKMTKTSEMILSISQHFSPLPHSLAASKLVEHPTTLQNALSHFFDFLCPPTKAIVVGLCGRLRKEGMIHISKPLADMIDDEVKWIQFIKQRAPTMLQLFLEIHRDDIPFEVWLSVWPAMRPRLYSIASAPVCGRNSMRLLISIANRGQIGGFMSEQHQKQKEGIEGPMIHGRISHSNFRLPRDDQKNAVMIAAGTGLAPFLAFLEEKQWLLRSKRNSCPTDGQTILFMGCRAAYDAICLSQLNEYIDSGVLTKMFSARSREIGERFKYVGDAIRDEADTIWTLLLDAKTNFYVCGVASTVGKSAQDALIDVMRSHGKLTDQECLSFMTRLRIDKRYVEDVWG